MRAFYVGLKVHFILSLRRFEGFITVIRRSSGRVQCLSLKLRFIGSLRRFEGRFLCLFTW